MIKNRSTLRDWLKVLILLLDEVVVIAVIIIVLQFLKIEIPLPIIIVIALIAGGFVFLIHFAVIPSFHKKQATGKESMIGQQVNIIEPPKPIGTVMFNGELWKAKTIDNEKIEANEKVKIVGIKGLTLLVKKS